MKFLRKHRLLPGLAAMGLFVSASPPAQAASAFASDATLTYTINSVTNLDHPGVLSDLSILGSFVQAGGPDSYAATSGDGAVAADNPSVGPLALTVGGSFAQSFALSGSAGVGTVDTSYLGQFALDFSNAGADHYAIGVTLAYQLNASVSGENADSGIYLDYYNLDSSFAGSDYLNAALLGVPINAKSGSSGLYSFNLGPGAAQSLYGGAVINGNLLGTTAAVPLPAAVWLFAPAVLGVFGAARRRKV